MVTQFTLGQQLGAPLQTWPFLQPWPAANEASAAMFGLAWCFLGGSVVCVYMVEKCIDFMQSEWDHRMLQITGSSLMNTICTSTNPFHYFNLPSKCIVHDRIVTSAVQAHGPFLKMLFASPKIRPVTILKPQKLSAQMDHHHRHGLGVLCQALCLCLPRY